MQPGPWPEGRALMALVAAKSQIRISSGWRGGNWPLPAAAAALPTAPPPPRDVLCSWGVTPLQPGEPPPARGPSVCPSFPPSLFLFPCIPAQHLSLPAPAKHRGYPQHRPGRGTTVFPPPPPAPLHPAPPLPSWPRKSQTRATSALSWPSKGACREPASEGCRGGCHGERACHWGGGSLLAKDKMSPRPLDWGGGGVSTGAGCPAPAPLTSPSAPSRHLSAPLAQACFPSPPASASTRPRTHPPAGLCRFHCLLPFAISSICSLPPPPRATASPPPVPSPPQAHPCPPAPWGASRRRGATPALPLEKRELTGARIMPPCTAFDANPGVPVPPAPAPADPWESWKVLSMGVRGSGPPPSTKAGGYLW